MYKLQRLIDKVLCTVSLSEYEVWLLRHSILLGAQVYAMGSSDLRELTAYLDEDGAYDTETAELQEIARIVLHAEQTRPGA